MTMYTRQQWIKRCVYIHENKYNYSLWPTQVRSNEVVPIICPYHGTFFQLLDNHIHGKGCPVCGNINRGKSNQKGKQYYITLCNTIHQNQYDYSLWPSEVKNNSKVMIVCNLHDVFFQTIDLHSRGYGCPKCGRDKAKITMKQKHGVCSPRQVTFSNETYKKLHDKKWLIQQYQKHKSAEHIAKILNVNGQTILNYLHQYNIDIINSHTSCAEEEIVNFCKSQSLDIICNDRTILRPKEIDIYLPKHKLAIEYCGLFWHSEQNGKDMWYHHHKYLKCKEQGIRLLTIFSDEWERNNNLIHHKILSIIGQDSSPVVYARKTHVIELSRKEKNTFLNTFHIQRTGPGSLNLGLMYQKSLVACMTFTKHKNQTYYLTRYATSCRVVGGFTKLVSWFSKTHDWTRIISFADLRWSQGKLYEKNGWILTKELPPDYYYSFPGGNNRIHKFNFRRKQLPTILNHFDENKSERVNCNNNGILRIWDCGKLKFELTNEKS